MADRNPSTRRAAPALALALALTGLTACSKAADPPAPSGTSAPSSTAAGSSSTAAGSSSTTSSAPGSTTSRRAGSTTTTEEADTTTTEVAAGSRVVDIGGLQVEFPLDATEPDPESGVTLTAESVYRLPGESFEELADVDVTNRQVTSGGKPAVIYLFGSDTLFDVGSATVKHTAEAALPAVVASLEKRAPKAAILVRGFTDSSGTADANQALSEQRAGAISAWLASHGIDQARITAIGYGSTHPAAEETTESGTALNRRIEIIAIG